MFKYQNSFLLFLLCLLLVACGGGKSAKEQEYLKSQQLPPLEVPPDLIQPKNNPELNIPKVQNNTDKNILVSVKNARFYRDGGIKWVRVNASVGQVWPKLISFWELRGYSIKFKDKQIGVIETNWLSERTQVKGKTPLKNKYRIRIEKGKNNSTLIFVSHRSLEKQSGKWRSLPASYENEVEMLRRILIHLGLTDKKAQAVINTVSQLGMRLKIKNSSSMSQLSIDGTKPRVWRRISLALDRAGMIFSQKKAGEYQLSKGKKQYSLNIKSTGETDTQVTMSPKLETKQIKALFSDFFII